MSECGIKVLQSGAAGYIATNRGCPARFGTIETYVRMLLLLLESHALDNCAYADNSNVTPLNAACQIV